MRLDDRLRVAAAPALFADLKALLGPALPEPRMTTADDDTRPPTSLDHRSTAERCSGRGRRPAAFLVAAVVVGLLWPQLVDPVDGRRAARSGCSPARWRWRTGSTRTAWYSVLGGWCGAAPRAVLALWRRGRTRSVTLLAIVAGACLAAWLSATVGTAARSRTTRAEVLADAEVGATAPDRVVVTADAAYLVWPISALVGAVVVLWSRPGTASTTRRTTAPDISHLPAAAAARDPMEAAPTRRRRENHVEQHPWSPDRPDPEPDGRVPRRERPPAGAQPPAYRPGGGRRRRGASASPARGPCGGAVHERGTGAGDRRARRRAGVRLRRPRPRRRPEDRGRADAPQVPGDPGGARLDAGEDLRRWLFEAITPRTVPASSTSTTTSTRGSATSCAVATMPGDDEPVLVFVVQVKDQDAGRGRASRRSPTCADEDVPGTAFVDEYMVVAETDDIADDLVADAEEGSLADDDEFDRWIDEAGGSGHHRGVRLRGRAGVPQQDDGAARRPTTWAG